MLYATSVVRVTVGRDFTSDRRERDEGFLQPPDDFQGTGAIARDGGEGIVNGVVTGAGALYQPLLGWLLDLASSVSASSMPKMT